MSVLRITINSSTIRARRFIPYLKKNLRLAHRLAKSPVKDFSIALVGDKKMIELHKKFMNIASSTDVLTFPLEFDSRRKCIGGEVIVCVNEADRAAREMKIDLKNELLLYALHGLLHLSGFDDKNQRLYRIMHRKEDAILRSLGVGPVFSKGRR